MSIIGVNHATQGGFLGPGTMNFMAGTMGGFGGVVVGHPFDTLKVRMQSGVRYPSTYACLRSIVVNEKPTALYKGITSPLVGVVLVNALLFGVYGALLAYQLPHPEATPTITQIFIAGAGSGFINSVISCPVELCKIKLQLQKDQPLTKGAAASAPKLPRLNGSFDCFRYIVRTQGPKGLFLGLNSTILREVPSYGAYFAAYEGFCRLLTPAPIVSSDGTKKDAELSGPRLMLAGGLAGIAGWISTYPIDVVKTQIQAQQPRGDRATRGWLQTGAEPIKQSLVKIIQAEGHAGLWRGFNATLLRAFPTNACTFFVWSQCMTLLKKWQE